MATTQHQTPLDLVQVLEPLQSLLLPTAMGLTVAQTHSALQADIVKEIANKLAWVLGSVYRVPYNNRGSVPRGYAWLMTKAILRDHGYPRKIGK